VAQADCIQKKFEVNFQQMMNFESWSANERINGGIWFNNFKWLTTVASLTVQAQHVLLKLM